MRDYNEKDAIYYADRYLNEVARLTKALEVAQTNAGEQLQRIITETDDDQIRLKATIQLKLLMF